LLPFPIAPPCPHCHTLGRSTVLPYPHPTRSAHFHSGCCATLYPHAFLTCILLPRHTQVGHGMDCFPHHTLWAACSHVQLPIKPWAFCGLLRLNVPLDHPANIPGLGWFWVSHSGCRHTGGAPPPPLSSSVGRAFSLMLAGTTPTTPPTACAYLPYFYRTHSSGVGLGHG